MSFYRLQDADRDAAALLDVDQHWSWQWGGLGDPRHGVSVCPNTDVLARYFARINEQNGGDMYDTEFLDSLVLVELDGDPSDEQDHDAHEGAELVIPTRIISVGPVPAGMVDAICGV